MDQVVEVQRDPDAISISSATSADQMVQTSLLSDLTGRITDFMRGRAPVDPDRRGDDDEGDHLQEMLNQYLDRFRMMKYHQLQKMRHHLQKIWRNAQSAKGHLGIEGRR